MYLPVTVGIDGSSASLAAAAWAAEEALLRGRPLRALQAQALMPHLLPSHSSPARPGSGPGDRSALQEVLHVLAVRCPDLSAHAVQVHDLPVAALVAAAEDAELLVLGARGDGGFDGLQLGSVALQVAARAGCPTVLLPAEAMDSVPREQVVVGVDARRPGEAALDFAFAAARRYGVPLRAVHAWPPPPGPGSRPSVLAAVRAQEADLLSAALTRWKATHPDVRVIEDVEPVGPGRLLVEASAKARLVVIGRRPAPAGDRLGPVAHAVLHRASCPVAVVPEA